MRSTTTVHAPTRPASGGRRRRIAHAVVSAAAVAGAALGTLLLAPAAQASNGAQPVPPEFAMEQVLKPIRCATAAENAGWRDDDLVIATAISLSESGCDPKAVGTNPPSSSCPNGSRDRGAWQINDCYHPSVSDACAFDLQCNANAAHDIWEEANDTFEPWTTWDTRQFKYFLDEARRAVNRLTGENIVVGVVTTTDGGALNIRKRHTTDSPIVGTLPHNAVITVLCQAHGENVYSPVFGYYTRLWDKIGDHQWVSDGYVYTDTADSDGRVGPRC